MKIQRADSLKTSHELLVQWQNQQNKKWSNVDGLFIESFLCFLVSLDRVTDIKTKTFFVILATEITFIIVHYREVVLPFSPQSLYQFYLPPERFVLKLIA